MAFAEKGEQVMLAHTEEVYVGDNHHFVVLDIEKSIVPRAKGRDYATPRVQAETRRRMSGMRRLLPLLLLGAALPAEAALLQ